jgi:hypothetical protein
MLKTLSARLWVNHGLNFGLFDLDGDPMLVKKLEANCELQIESVEDDRHDTRYDLWLRMMDGAKVAQEVSIAKGLMDTKLTGAVVKSFLEHYKDDFTLLFLQSPEPAKKPIAVQNFELAVQNAVEARDEKTGEVRPEHTRAVQSFYERLTDDQKVAAKDSLHEGMKGAMSKMEITLARAYLVLKDSLGSIEYGVGIDLETDEDDPEAKFIKISDPDEHQLVAFYSPGPDPKPIAGVDLFTDHIDLGHWLFDEWIVIASLDLDGRRRTV